MVIIYGHRMYGKADRVPGLFHVTTRFGHIYYIPIIPTGSFLMLEGGTEGRCVRIGWNFKSLFLAWGRVALIFGGVFGAAATAIVLREKGGKDLMPALGYGAFAMVCVTLLVLSYKLRRVGLASYERAVTLAEKAEFSEEGLVMLEAAMGRITEAEAKTAIEALQKDAREADKIRTEINLAT